MALQVLLSLPVFGRFSGTLGREAVLYSGLLLSGKVEGQGAAFGLACSEQLEG